MDNINTMDRRNISRFKAPSAVYTMITSEEYERTGFLLDLSMHGASFEYILTDSPLTKANEISISSPKENFHLDNLPCSLIFDIPASDQEHEPVVWRGAGVQFQSLSKNQKKCLFDLINDHWGYPIQPPSQSIAKTVSPPDLLDNDNIFLSRLKLLVIGAKAYLRGYPCNAYRENAISRNAQRILRQLPRQTPFGFEESHNLLFQEHVLLLSKVFSRFPVSSRETANIEKSIECVSEHLKVDRPLAQMEFLKVA